MNILFITGHELNDDELILMKNILKSLNLNLDGVDLLCWDFTKLIHELPRRLSQIDYTYIVTFGFKLTSLDKYVPVKFEHRYFLEADPLWVLIDNPQLKKKLWGCLQAIFLKPVEA